MIKRLFNTLGLVFTLLLTCFITTELNKEVNIIEETIKDIPATVEHYFPDLKPLRTEEPNISNLNNYSNNNDISNELINIKNVFNDLDQQSKEELNNIARDYIEVKEMLDSVYNSNKILTNNSLNSTNYSYLTSKLGRLLTYAGVPLFAANIIKGSVTTVEVVARMRFLWSYIKAGIILASLVATVVIVVTYWDNIQPIFNEIANIYFKAALGFFGIVTNIINKIIESTRENERVGSGIALTKEQIEAILKKKNKIEKIKAYYFTYVNRKNIIIIDKNPLTYIQAFCCLKFILRDDEKLTPKWLRRLNILPLDIIKDKDVNREKLGVYTDNMSNAGALAFKTGAIEVTTYDRHGRGANYLPHFHDSERKIHIWFKYFI